MANRTVKDAHSVKGTNPQYLIEKIIRTRIYESKYWKEQCFALSAELLVDKAMELRFVGGIFGGNVKPTPFLCLILKMLQIQPEKDIVVEFITQQDFKYVRVLGAVYMRLTGTSLDCYNYLEPLLLDYRKLRRMDRNGKFELVHMDEFVDELITEERIIDIILPRIQKRQVLEETNHLDARVSAIDDDLDDIESSDEEEEKMDTVIPSPTKVPSVRERPRRSPSPYGRKRSRSPHKRRSRSRERDRGHRERREEKREEKREDKREDKRDRHRERRERKRSRSKERHRSSRHDEDDDSRRHKHKSSRKDKDKEHRSSRKDKELDEDIKQANELRKKLGMAPLRP